MNDILKRNKNSKLIEKEITSLRGDLGKINRVAGMLAPEISYYVCEISTRVKNVTITDIFTINKVIKFIMSTPSQITIPVMNLGSLQLLLYSNASFNNLPEGASKGGYIVFLGNKFSNSAPIAWNSTRLKRFTRSTLAAETLALTDSCDTAFFSANLITDIMQIPTISVTVLTDNQSLHDTIKSSKLTLNHQLCIEVSALQGMCSRNEISIYLRSKFSYN